jgi:magnesium chelatase family protein
MSLALVHTRAHLGVAAPEVTVEVHIGTGMPGFFLVGLPETAVRESRDRVRSALVNSHFKFPQQRITVNLAPADLPKNGGRFDLAVALGILAASDQLSPSALAHFEFIGELALSGQLRAVGAVLPAALACRQAGRSLVLAGGDAKEAGLVQQLKVFPADTLLSVCAHLSASVLLPEQPSADLRPAEPEDDLTAVKGQATARRVLEIAAAGAHNLLFCGPPGTGKTMLASRMPGILPPLDDSEWLEVAALRSIAGDAPTAVASRQRPFRSPHHSCSPAALIGGGSMPRPGEASLAHRGVLFLDELPEYPRRALEALREPLESGDVVISRAARSLRFPARFQLLAAMNPCPCGYHGDEERLCRCSPDQIKRYRDRISGPLLDRIDMHLFVARPASGVLLKPGLGGESSAVVRSRVMACRHRQLQRQGCCNAQLKARDQDQDQCLALHDAERCLLVRAAECFTLSARACQRTLRVARTIADLNDAERIESQHLQEALAYRADMNQA